ncbi:hypothetical protein HII17_06740, partial [Thalassotalea sp. M1531]
MPVVSAQEAGIRIRGPKSTDVFPHERYGPITSSDTLWKIALTIRPEPSVTVYQVMQALYEMNPNAFANNNRNHLVNGQYLQIPSIEKIRLIDPYVAKRSSESDDRSWKKKDTATTTVAQQPIKPEELSVKKKDLDKAKVEINEKLDTFDTEQKQKLDTIQQDVLDSIDGLQAILKENESLKQSQSKLNEQIDIVKQEAAKDTQELQEYLEQLLAIQKDLAAKEEERQRQELLKAQQAELEQQNWMNSLWFKVLMGTIPALFIAGIVAFIIARKKKSQPEEQTPVVEKAVQPPEIESAPEVEEAAEEDLSLDGELSLDDELSIDLTESDDESDDLFSDGMDDLGDLDDELDAALTDDVIHLDDDLDELDDLEDISLDDDLDELSEEGEPLGGDELDQGDLDDLLSGIDDDVEEESEPLDGGELDQGDLDDLLSGLDDSGDDSEPLEGGELGQDALDDLLSENANEPAADEIATEEDEVDIDAIIDESSAESSVDEIEDGADVTDPDDIDALLASAGDSAAEPEVDSAVDAIEDGADVTDP